MWCHFILLAWVLFFSLRLFKRLKDNHLFMKTYYEMGYSQLKRIYENITIISEYRKLRCSGCSKITSTENMVLQIYKHSELK